MPIVVGGLCVANGSFSFVYELGMFEVVTRGDRIFKRIFWVKSRCYDTF